MKLFPKKIKPRPKAEINTDSDTWHCIVRLIEEEQAQIDRQLRNPNLPEKDTQLLRGEYRKLEWLLNRPKRQAVDITTSLFRNT